MAQWELLDERYLWWRDVFCNLDSVFAPFLQIQELNGFYRLGDKVINASVALSFKLEAPVRALEMGLLSETEP